MYCERIVMQDPYVICQQAEVAIASGTVLAVGAIAATYFAHQMNALNENILPENRVEVLLVRATLIISCSCAAVTGVAIALIGLVVLLDLM